MRLKRFVAALAVLAGTAALVAPVAGADPPSRAPNPTPDFTAALCPGFDVQVHVVANNEVGKTFSDGRFIGNGTFKVQLTNASTGKSITVNASGPVFVSSDGSTEVLRGDSIIFFLAGDLGPGSPPVLHLDHGPVTITYAADGSVTSLTEQANVTDLCPLLAGA